MFNRVFDQVFAYNYTQETIKKETESNECDFMNTFMSSENEETQMKNEDYSDSLTVSVSFNDSIQNNSIASNTTNQNNQNFTIIENNITNSTKSIKSFGNEVNVTQFDPNKIQIIQFTEDQYQEAASMMKDIYPNFKSFNHKSFTLSLNSITQLYDIRKRDLVIIEAIANAMQTYPIFYQNYGIGLQCMNWYFILTLNGIYSPKTYALLYQLQPFIDIKDGIVLTVQQNVNTQFSITPPSSMMRVKINSPHDERKLVQFMESKPKLNKKRMNCEKNCLCLENYSERIFDYRNQLSMKQMKQKEMMKESLFVGRDFIKDQIANL